MAVKDDEKDEKDIDDQEGQNKNPENVDNNNDDNTGSNNESGKNDDKDSKNDETYTKAQLNKEKNASRVAAFKELGIDPKDKATMNAVKAFIESQKTDEDKNNEDKQQLAEANKKVMIAEAKAEAMELGVKSQFVEDAVTLALAKKTEEEDIKTVLAEFRKKYPVWFSKDDDNDEDNKGKKGTGSNVGRDKSKKNDDKKVGIGARLAAQRTKKSNKKSYWD